MKDKFEIMRVPIAGLEHHEHSRAARLAVGDTVAFVAEPDNPHDDHAVRVYRTVSTPTTTIGYIPKSVSPIFSRIIEGGYPLTGEVVTIIQKPDAVVVSVCMRRAQ